MFREECDTTSLSISYQDPYEQAVIALKNNQIKTAHSCLVKLIEVNPKDAKAYFLLAKVHIKIGQLSKATKLITKALSFQESTEYRAELAKCYALTGELKLVKESVKSIQACDVKHAITSDSIGVSLSRAGAHSAATLFFQQAIKLNDKVAEFHYNLGVSCKFTGDIELAIRSFELAITLNENHVAAHYALSELSPSDRSTNQIGKMLKVYDKVTQPDDLLYISHALAREYEKLDDYDRAFKILGRAKQEKKALVNYQFTNDLTTFNTLNRQLDTQPFNNKVGCEDDSPIFVVGMPRTGTTVVERMLTHSPNVHSAGELPDFAILIKQLSKDRSNSILSDGVLNNLNDIDFKQLGEAYLKKAKPISNGKEWFVDKMPLNVLYSQLILTALPKAKIVCLLRNPLDTIVSNYRQLFASNFSYYHYSLDLNDTYSFYKAFKAYAQQCAKAYPDNFKLVSYEELVKNPLNSSKDIFEFCDIPWEKNYTQIENNKTPVDTASALQVRRPITKNNVGNWRKYEVMLSGIIKQMKNDGIEQPI